MQSVRVASIASAVAWVLMAAWCAAGYPPCVDLPVHAAQMQTMAALLRGDPAVSQVYELHVELGYGLVYWIFLPVTLATSGATAARVALWLSLVLFPLALLVLLRAFRRPDWYVLLGLPLAFSVSYYYGFLPYLLGMPLCMLALAAAARAFEEPSPRRLVLLNLAAAAAALAHLLSFAAFATGALGLALAERPRARRVARLAAGLVLPAALVIPRVVTMAVRATAERRGYDYGRGPLPHLTWFWENYAPEGVLVIVAPAAVALAFTLRWLTRRRAEPAGPLGLALGLLVLYFLLPKSMSGIWGVFIRLPALMGVAVLLLVDGAAWGRRARLALIALSLAAVAEALVFHARFARAVDGLAEVVASAPPGARTGYVALGGDPVLGSRHIYGRHLGSWLVASRGGVDVFIFGEADHYPARFLPGFLPPLPLHQPSWYDTVLLYGEGKIPGPLASFRETARAGSWRRLEH